MPIPERMDRRHFASQLALGATGLAAVITPCSGSASAEDKPADKQPDGKPMANGEKKPVEAEAQPELPSAEVLLLTYLARRYPSDHFDEEALQGIYRDIRGDQARGQQLSEFALKNSDEPAFVFAAFHNQQNSTEPSKTKDAN